MYLTKKQLEDIKSNIIDVSILLYRYADDLSHKAYISDSRPIKNMYYNDANHCNKTHKELMMLYDFITSIIYDMDDDSICTIETDAIPY